MTGYKVKYHGPTDFNGSRYTVTNLQTGKRKTVPYDYRANNAAKSAIVKAFNVSPSALFFVGSDTQYTYYVNMED